MEQVQTDSRIMKAGSSRRDFIRRTFFGAAIGGLVAKARGASSSAQTGSPSVDRRRLGRLNADVSILGLGLGGAFMDWYDRSLETDRALLESALMRGINCWDTARSYGPSEGMIAPVLARNRNGVFLMSKSDARDYEGFKRDLHRSLQILGTDYIDVYHLHDMRSHEFANLSAIESGAVRAAREAKEQKIIRGFGVTGHSGAVILIECVKRFDPHVILTIFPATRPDNGRYEDELLPLARGRKIGVIAMKAIRYGRQANLPAKELLRYALSLNGVDAAIVGLDSQAHLNENASIASSFKPMKEADRTELHGRAGQALAGIPAPWDRPGYIDGQTVT